MSNKNIFNPYSLQKLCEIRVAGEYSMSSIIMSEEIPLFLKRKICKDMNLLKTLSVPKLTSPSPPAKIVYSCLLSCYVFLDKDNYKEFWGRSHDRKFIRKHLEMQFPSFRCCYKENFYSTTHGNYCKHCFEYMCARALGKGVIERDYYAFLKNCVFKFKMSHLEITLRDKHIDMCLNPRNYCNFCNITFLYEINPSDRCTEMDHMDFNVQYSSDEYTSSDSEDN